MLSAGQRIGHIQIVARIGSGGMGEVWEGLDEKLGRYVAVKTIRRSEADPAAARARSAREARILSRLEHPNICRLYEYVELEECDLLVLELVRGRSLRRAIEAGSVPAGLRLDAALGICSALVAAHALSIVHRDLKPENVMLAEDGSVKVLDFGIARRVLPGDPPIPRPVVDPPAGVAAPAGEDGANATAATAGLMTGAVATTASVDTVGPLTATGHVLGTPRYMSPEQARGEQATAASDMYSFGLLLAELYSGKPAYGSGANALVRAQWGDVVPPRGIDRAVGALVGRLTTLDPQCRPSAQETLERLRVIQRRPLRRLRNAAVAIAAAGLVIGTGLSLHGLAQARREAATAKAATDFLVSLFLGSDPQEAPNPDVKAREIVDRGVAKLQSELKDEPATRARLLTALGRIYGNFGMFEKEQRLLEEALALQESLAGRNDPSLFPILRGLAHAYDAQAKYQAADDSLRRAETIAVRAKARLDEAEALDLRAASLQARGRLGEAEPLARRALALREAALGPDHRKTASTRMTLALMEFDRGHYAEAEAGLESALVALERELGPDHFEVAEALGNLAETRKELGRAKEAVALYRRSLAITEKRLGPAHPQCALVHGNLGATLMDLKDHAAAAEQYRRAVAIGEAGLGVEHPVTAVFRANLGEAYLMLGRAAEAERLYRSALRAQQAAYGRQHSWVAETLRGLGQVCAARGQTREAESLLVESAAVREAVDGPDHPQLGRVLTQLGRFYLARGDRERAAPVLARARRILEAAYSGDHPALVELRVALAESAGRTAPARASSRPEAAR